MKRTVPALFLFLTLAAALLLAACNRAPLPPVIDETDAAETTGVPDVTAAPDTTGIPETAAPETKAPETSAPVTTAPVTTKAPAVTTRTPETTAPPAVTTAPETEPFVPPEPVADFEPVFPTMPEELASLLYTGEDGYAHIKGSDNIRLPAQGEYLVYDRYLSEKDSQKSTDSTAYFVSRELVMTIENADAPASSLLPGVFSSHSFTLEPGLLTIRYRGGETVCRIPLHLFALESGQAADLSGEVTCASYFITEAVSIFNLQKEKGDYFLAVFDRGETVTLFGRSYNEKQVCFNTQRKGLAISGVWPAAGTRFLLPAFSTDLGLSFTVAGTTYHFSIRNDYDAEARNWTEFPYLVYHPRKPVSLIAYGDDVYLTGWWSLETSREPWEGFEGFSIHRIDLPDRYADGAYLYATTDCPPYFDGEIGVFALRTEFIPDGKVGRYDLGETVVLYHYYVSLDRGETWIPYSPAQAGEPAVLSAIWAEYITLVR